MPHKIIIVDDHPICLLGLESIIDQMPDCRLAAKYTDVSNALEGIAEHNPDVVITDLAMPGSDGYELIVSVNNISPSTRIIVYTMLTRAHDLHKAMAENIHGYVVKGDSIKEIERAIRTVIKGGTYFSASLKDILFNQLNNHHIVHISPPRLTLREKQVLQLIYQEKTTREIAEELHLAFGTVEIYRNNLLKKFGCKNVVGLIKAAQERNMV